MWLYMYKTIKHMLTISSPNYLIEGSSSLPPPLESDLLYVHSVCMLRSSYGSLFARWSTKKRPIPFTLQQLPRLTSEMKRAYIHIKRYE